LAYQFVVVIVLVLRVATVLVGVIVTVVVGVDAVEVAGLLKLLCKLQRC
jgi:hypothetical protein